MPQQERKIIVKFLDSIAGLADVDQGKLDQKYAQKRALLADQEMGLKSIERIIEQDKELDGYREGGNQRGFQRDFCFKIGQEVCLPEGIAKKWIAAGICLELAEFTQGPGFAKLAGV